MYAATAVAHAPQALAARLGPRTQVIVDPQTSRLDAALGWSVAQDGDFKPAYRRLFSRYLRKIEERPQPTSWRAATAVERSQLIDNVVEYQFRELERRHNSDLELFGIETLPSAASHLRPTRIMSAYQLVQTPEDLNYQVSLWADSPPTYRGTPIDFVLALSPRMVGHAAAIPGLARATRGRRVWLALPEFRQEARMPRGHVAARHAVRLVRQLSHDSEVALIGASFEVLSLTGRFIRSVAFSPHLSDGRVHKSRGGRSVPVSYVSTVHDWIGYPRLGSVISHAHDAAEFAAWFCDDPSCVAMFDRLGPRAFARRMFSTVSRGSRIVATRESRGLQLEHGVRARTREIETVANVSMHDLAVLLESAARQSPFLEARNRLEGWAMVLRGTERLAA